MIRLRDPSPDQTHTRTPIPVRFEQQRVAWALFNNGKYEFEADDQAAEQIASGSHSATFEMDGFRPRAIVFAVV
jgi:hypothetical protein